MDSSAEMYQKTAFRRQPVFMPDYSLGGIFSQVE